MLECIENRLGASRCIAYCIARGLIISFLFLPIGIISGEDIGHAIIWSVVFAIFAPIMLAYCRGFLGYVEIAAEIAAFVWMFAGEYDPSVSYPGWVLPSFAIAGLLEFLLIIFGFAMIAVDKSECTDSGDNKHLLSAGTVVAIIAIMLGATAAITCYIIGDHFGHEKGYRIGYDDGYVDGYTDGDAEGYEAGYDDGYADGEDYGYGRGYDAGHDSGVADSYTPSTYSYETYIGNANSYKFHRESCSYLPADWNQVFFYSREDAVNAGYDPCQKCNP